MRKKITFFIIFTLFSSCTLTKINYEETIYSVDEFQDIKREIEWIIFSENKRIKYISDEKKHGIHDLWQTPEITYKLKTGDCEDFCLYIANLLYKKYNIKPLLISVYNVERKSYHIILYTHFYYFDYLQTFQKLPEKYIFKGAKNFEESLKRAKEDCKNYFNSEVK